MGTHDTTSPSESWGRQEGRHNTPSHDTSNSQSLYKDFSLAFQDSNSQCLYKAFSLAFKTAGGGRNALQPAAQDLWSLFHEQSRSVLKKVCAEIFWEKRERESWSESNRENNRTGLNSAVFFVGDYSGGCLRRHDHGSVYQALLLNVHALRRRWSMLLQPLPKFMSTSSIWKRSWWRFCIKNCVVHRWWRNSYRRRRRQRQD